MPSVGGDGFHRDTAPRLAKGSLFMPMKRQQRSSITAAIVLLSGLLLLAAPALACGGGGGTGGYRKPVRPDHFNHNGTQQPNATSSAPAPSPSGQAQSNGF
jgi:hypothetical protein